MCADYVEKAVTAIQQLRKWEQKKDDLEKMLISVRRKKKKLKRKIDEIDMALSSYPGEDSHLELESSTGFPAGRQ